MTPIEAIKLCEQTAIDFSEEIAEFNFDCVPLLRKYFLEDRYYSMLAAYAKVSGARHALDLGCSGGLSALAMAKYAAKVTTVDINFDAVFDRTMFEKRHIRKWLVTGAEQPSSFDFSPYDMIFVDVNGHEGPYERDLHKKLTETWTGLAFYDDINFPGMTQFWYDITLPKALADWHHSGFGVVQYGKGA